ncbi:hypothetical protein LTR10_004990 [Elasticomyces elasticus]|nr:hypothetical protein LTR10_004990 [Elasticomyces elasticus]KAK4975733.1 hypothetical protein LTR42_003352 [Elasticomyces elasticus]
MEHSTLNRLPPELRDEVYRLALTMKRPTELRTIHYHDTYDPHHADELGCGVYHGHAPGESASNNLALLRTCKQMYQEAAKFVFSCNEFRLDINKSTCHQGLNGSPTYRKKTRVLVARFISAIRPEMGNVPKAIEIRSLNLYMCDIRNMLAKTEVAAVLSDLQPLAARLPTCEPRVNLRIHISIPNGEHNESHIKTYQVPVQVRDPGRSLDEFAAQVRAGRYPDPYSGPNTTALSPREVNYACGELEIMKELLHGALSSPQQEMTGPWQRHPLNGLGEDEALFSWLNTHGITTWRLAEARALLMTDEEETNLFNNHTVSSTNAPLRSKKDAPLHVESYDPPAESDMSSTLHSVPSFDGRERYESFLDRHKAALPIDAEMSDDVAFAVAMARLVAGKRR